MTREPLKDRIHRIDGCDVKSFHVLFTEGAWKTWAIFYVDESTGTLAIVSDFGSWSHRWGGGPQHWGAPTFLEFLKGASEGYIADKLCYGRTRELVDADATGKAMMEDLKKRCLSDEKQGELEDDIADLVGRLKDGGGDRASVAWAIGGAAQELREYFELHEDLVYKTAPKAAFLIEQLIPAFQEVLRRAETDAVGCAHCGQSDGNRHRPWCPTRRRPMTGEEKAE